MGAKADVLCAVRADADVLLQWVDSDYVGQLTHLMPFLPPEVWALQRGRVLHNTCKILQLCLIDVRRESVTPIAAVCSREDGIRLDQAALLACQYLCSSPV